MSVATSPYLSNNFAPVTQEVTVTDLEVSGTIPAHLDGRYVRNGPNPITAPDPATYHWFTGTGMLHGIRLRDGKAEWYRNRWVRNSEVADTLGEPRRPGPVHGGFDFAPNTSVFAQDGRTFAVVEAGSLPYELTDTLDTVGSCDFDGTLDGGFSAHPHRDPDTGEMHTMSYFFGWGNNVQYTVLGTDARIRRTVNIEVGASPMMHDFSLTDRHVLIYDLPVIFDLDIISAGGSFPYSWDPNYPARIGVMDRDSDGTDVHWFDVDPCYVFHPLNAYEDGDTIIADVIRHPRMFDTDRLGPHEGVPTLDRWTFDLTAGSVTETRLDERGQEFPRIDERLTGKRHRFGYSVGLPGADNPLRLGASMLLRHDLDTDSTTSRSFGPSTSVGEFIFLANDPEAAEDDGVLMGFVHDAATDRSALHVVDATTLEDVASVALPVRVPEGFHGNWLPT